MGVRLLVRSRDRSEGLARAIGSRSWLGSRRGSRGRQRSRRESATNKPDVAIFDISMPSLDGPEAARQIVKSVSQTNVLVLTMYDSDPLVQQMLEGDARGYILKSDAVRDLVTAVDALRRNKTFLTPKVAQLVLKGYLDKNKKETCRKMAVPV